MKKLFVVILISVSLLLGGCNVAFAPAMLILLLKNDESTQIETQEIKLQKNIEPAALA